MDGGTNSILPSREPTTSAGRPSGMWSSSSGSSRIRRALRRRRCDRHDKHSARHRAHATATNVSGTTRRSFHSLSGARRRGGLLRLFAEGKFPARPIRASARSCPPSCWPRWTAARRHLFQSSLPRSLPRLDRRRGRPDRRGHGQASRRLRRYRRQSASVRRRFLQQRRSGRHRPGDGGPRVCAEAGAQRRFVAVCIGDGTLGEGVVYETLNIAAKWGLPLLVMLENNLYAQSTSQRETLAGESVRERQPLAFRLFMGTPGSTRSFARSLCERSSSSGTSARRRSSAWTPIVWPPILRAMTIATRGDCEFADAIPSTVPGGRKPRPDSLVRYPRARGEREREGRTSPSASHRSRMQPRARGVPAYDRLQHPARGDQPRAAQWLPTIRARSCSVRTSAPLTAAPSKPRAACPTSFPTVSSIRRSARPVSSGSATDWRSAGDGRSSRSCSATSWTCASTSC